MPISQESTVILDSGSAPRLVACGEDFLCARLPVGTRVVYPPLPLEPLSDLGAAVRHALEHPHGCDPLRVRLRPGMRVTIALDDISQPLPPMRGEDVRQTVLEVLLPLLAEGGVEDVEIVVAIGLHRRMTAAEIERMVGPRIFGAFYPHRLYNHDAEDPEGIVEVGSLRPGLPVAVSRRAVESDLVIYVSLPLGPISGGHKSVAVGLGAYRTIRAHHSAAVLRETESYMEPDRSALHSGIAEVGRHLAEQIEIFHLEVVLDTRMFGPALDFLSKNEDQYTAADRLKLRSMLVAFQALPQGLKRRALRAVRSPYRAIAVHAGTTEAAHTETLASQREQQVVRLEGQADILVLGIPYLSPYSVNSFLNPLHVQVMGMGYFFHLQRGTPVVRRGGTLILCHPCAYEFDREQHPSYVEFFDELLPETRDAALLQERYEEEFACRPEYVRAYRCGYAYHGAHPFFMWYWGERCRHWVGRIIAAGAMDRRVTDRLGWEAAASLDEALEMARDGQPASPAITMLHLTPHFVCDVG